MGNTPARIGSLPPPQRRGSDPLELRVGLDSRAEASTHLRIRANDIVEGVLPVLAARMAHDAWGELNALQAVTLSPETRAAFLDRRINLCKNHGFPLGLAQAYLEKAEGELGTPAEIDANFTNSVDHFRRCGHSIGVIQSLTSRARWLMKRGDPAGAITALEEALVLGQEFPSSPNTWRAAVELAWILAKDFPAQAQALVEMVYREASCEPGSRLELTLLEARVIESCALRDHLQVRVRLSEFRDACENLRHMTTFFQVESAVARCA